MFVFKKTLLSIYSALEINLIHGCFLEMLSPLKVTCKTKVNQMHSYFTLIERHLLQLEMQ